METAESMDNDDKNAGLTAPPLMPGPYSTALTQDRERVVIVLCVMLNGRTDATELLVDAVHRMGLQEKVLPALANVCQGSPNSDLAQIRAYADAAIDWYAKCAMPNSPMDAAELLVEAAHRLGLQSLVLPALASVSQASPSSDLSQDELQRARKVLAVEWRCRRATKSAFLVWCASAGRQPSPAVAQASPGMVKITGTTTWVERDAALRDAAYSLSATPIRSPFKASPSKSSEVPILSKFDMKMGDRQGASPRLTAQGIDEVLSTNDISSEQDRRLILSSKSTPESFLTPSGLPFATPDDLPADLMSNNDYRAICRVLKAKYNRSLDEWTRRALYEEKAWAMREKAMSSTTPHRDAHTAMTNLQDPDVMLPAQFKQRLRSASPEVAATAWNLYRRHLLTSLKKVLITGGDWEEALIVLKNHYEDDVEGYPRLHNYVKLALKNDALIRYPLLHADVLVLVVDESYLRQCRTFDPECNSAEWDRTTERRAGEDLVTLANRVVEAYLTKIGQPDLNIANIHLSNDMHRNTLAERFKECLLADSDSLERGMKLHDQFTSKWAFLSDKIKNRQMTDMSETCLETLASELSCYEIGHCSRLVQVSEEDQRVMADGNYDAHTGPPLLMLPQRQRHGPQGQGARERRNMRRLGLQSNPTESIDDE